MMYLSMSVLCREDYVDVHI